MRSMKPIEIGESVKSLLLLYINIYKTIFIDWEVQTPYSVPRLKNGNYDNPSKMLGDNHCWEFNGPITLEICKIMHAFLKA
jgi:hypothetical protein